MTPVLVSTSAELAAAAQALEGAPRYFIDTEFESGPGVRRLSLVQVSRDADRVYLVDALKLAALEPLAKVVGRPDAEWVLHAGRFDVELLLQACRLAQPPALFDTQVAWGLLGPEYPVSLAYLLYRVLGLRSLKGEQSGDWTRRPLTPEQVEYAAEDVAHLPELREILGARLREKGREAACAAASAEACQEEMEKALTLDDFRNAWQLDGPGLAVLKHLIEAHNALPEEERGTSLPPRAFLPVAKLIPESAEEFARIKGVPYAWVKRQGASTANKLVRIAFEARKEPFEPLEPPPYATWPEVLAEGKLRDLAARACAALEVSPELLVPGRVLKAMAAKAIAGGRPEEALAGWRRELAGASFH
jgi:ribonuclease D